MKRILLALCAIMAIVSVQATVIEKTYYFSDYQIANHGDYQSIIFKNTLLTGIAGQPALPYQSVSLLLPPGESAISIEVICENEVAINGFFKLYPQQYSRPISKGKSGKFALDEIIYNKNADYPVKAYGHLSTQFMNGYGFAQSAFTPVKYNPVSGKLFYYKKVTIRIVAASGKDAADALKNLNSKENVRQSVKNLAQNPEFIASYPIQKPRTDSYDMLIITSNAFSGQFLSLINFYQIRGLKVQEVTTDAISSQIAGQDLPEKIRNYIIQQYQEKSIQYVLLAGDVEIVPYRGFYCFVTSGGGNQEDSNIPSDLYYSSLDGNWNTDGDDKWGEIGEDDLLPDVSVARMPFSTQTELTHMLNKTMSYQGNPVLGEMTNPLLAGEHLYDEPNTEGSDYLRMIIGHHEDNGYTTDGITSDNVIDSMFSEHVNWSGGDLIEQLNTGKSFLHHVGHANETYVMYLSNSDITDQNFYAVNGTTHNYALIYTHGCLCGSFDYNDCIAEEMVGIANFAAAFVGNSRYGWFNEGQTEGPSAHLHREFVDALYNDHLLQIGQAHAESKAATSPWVNAPGQWEDGALRWCFYDCNVLGDPAMRIWTVEPISIQATYPTSITIGQISMPVTVTSNGSPLALFNCVLMKDGIVYGTATTDENGQAEIAIDPAITLPGDADLIISGNNCLPHHFTITVIPSGTAYVIYLSNTINDSQGNNNGMLDYGENIQLTVTLNNVGSFTAPNVMATLTTNDTYITLTDNTENYGDINAGQSVSKDNAFTFTVANNIPNNHLIEFNITAEGGGSWNSSFTLSANAPSLVTGNISIDDIAGGNGNHQLDPGETATLQIQTTNSGLSDISGLTAMLSTTNPYVNIINPSFNIENITAGNAVTATYEVTVDNVTPIGTVVDFLYLIEGNYGLQRTYNISVGLIFEDFETGDFTKYDWQNGGDQPWIINSTNPYEGTYCVQSGIITDNQSSEFSLTAEVISADTISFFRKVSSEEDYDFLRFYIDNQQMDEWSGEKDWVLVQYPVTVGIHTFSWIYSKDWMESGGNDQANIDYIVFPPVDFETSISEKPANDEFFSFYPNPCKGSIMLHFEQTAKSDVNIKIMNSVGNIMYNKNVSLNNNEFPLNINNLSEGIYTIIVNNNSMIKSKKLIIQK
ncbi:MAG: C25 family cysteine peptidase [Lentimicrobiaceae bacterium]|nr:C25 family cysteine peptidase [Lentimicrobiaceae bacterium]